MIVCLSLYLSLHRNEHQRFYLESKVGVNFEVFEVFGKKNSPYIRINAVFLLVRTSSSSARTKTAAAPLHRGCAEVGFVTFTHDPCNQFPLLPLPASQIIIDKLGNLKPLSIMRNFPVIAASLPLKQENAQSFKSSQVVHCCNGSSKQVVPFASTFVIDVYHCHNIARARNNSLFIHSFAL